MHTICHLHIAGFLFLIAVMGLLRTWNLVIGFVLESRRRKARAH